MLNLFCREPYIFKRTDKLLVLTQTWKKLTLLNGQPAKLRHWPIPWDQTTMVSWWSLKSTRWSGSRMCLARAQRRMRPSWENSTWKGQRGISVSSCLTGACKPKVMDSHCIKNQNLSNIFQISEFHGRWQELHFPFLNRAAVRQPVVVVVGLCHLAAYWWRLFVPHQYKPI